MQLTREKGGPRPKKAVQNGSKLFSDAFSAGESLSFQGINCKNFCQEKVENAKKCKKCNIQGKKGPSQKKCKKNSKKIQPHSKKYMQNAPKCKKKCVGIFSPLYFGIGLASFWGRFGVVLASFWDHFGRFLAPVGPFLTFWGPFLMVIFGCFWTIFGIFWVILGRFWTIFGSIRSRFGVT